MTEAPKLRDYQQRGIDETAARWSLQDVRSVLLVLPTGGGKTVIAVSMILRALAKGKRVLFVVHREELVANVGKRLLEAGVTDLCLHAQGRMQGSPTATVHVGMIQTYTAHGVRPADVGLIIVDEAHHTVARTYRALIACYPKVPVLGLTATPERTDRSPLGDVFDEMVVCSSVAELVALGWLVACRVVRPAKALGGPAAAPLTAYARFASGRPGVGFIGRTAEAAEQAAQFERFGGYSSGAVDGKTDDGLRRRLLARAHTDLDVLWNVAVCTEGVDVPRWEVCIMAAGTSSVSMFLQRIGRILRAYPGKSGAILLDLCGAVHLHGLPDDPWQWSLTGPAKNGRTSKLWTCGSCFAVLAEHPGGPCPQCGAVPEITAQEKRAQEADLSEQHKIASQPEKYAVFRGLVETAIARGYKPGWIGLRFKEQFGRHPPFRLPPELKKGGAHA